MKKPKRLPVILSRDEIARMKAVPDLNTLTGLRDRVLLEVFHGSGLRLAEVLALTGGDVRTVGVNGSSRTMIEVRQGKGSRDRVVPITAATADWIARWAAVKPQGERLFCSLSGAPLSRSYVQQLVAELGAKVGVKGRTHPHLLRHAFAVEALEAGAPLTFIQELLGHSDLKTTTVYLRTRPGAIADWVSQRTDQ